MNENMYSQRYLLCILSARWARLSRQIRAEYPTGSWGGALLSGIPVEGFRYKRDRRTASTKDLTPALALRLIDVLDLYPTN